MLPTPARAMRGLMLAKRFSDTSMAYKRPVLFIIAAKAKVLPPAPAQKSTTTSPRFAPEIKANNWLPSSCTSKKPSKNKAFLLMAALS